MKTKNLKGIARKRTQKHRPYGARIIRNFKVGGREYQLHATKGWRSYRA